MTFVRLLPYRFVFNFAFHHNSSIPWRFQKPNLFLPCCKYSNQSSADTFKGEIDRYNGVTVDYSKENCGQENFVKLLEGSLTKWQDEGKKCAWFKININEASLVPILAQVRKCEIYHNIDLLTCMFAKSSTALDGKITKLRRYLHRLPDEHFRRIYLRQNSTLWCSALELKGDFVMMYKWLAHNLEPNLPPASHVNLGVGAMVFNDQNLLLAISEKNYEYPHWKLPGGYVEQGEDIIAAAIREVREETGVNCSFESLVTFRHQHNMMFGNSDIYILLRMKALTDKIIMAEREIKACKWMDVEEYTNHPHVHVLNRLMVKKALEYKSKNIHLNFQKQTVKWATYVRDMNYLLIETS